MQRRKHRRRIHYHRQVHITPMVRGSSGTCIRSQVSAEPLQNARGRGAVLDVKKERFVDLSSLTDLTQLSRERDMTGLPKRVPKPLELNMKGEW